MPCVNRTDTIEWSFGKNVEFDVNDLVIISLLVVLLVLMCTMMWLVRRKLDKMHVLFSDFFRFYIHISKPPSKELTNMDLFNDICSKLSISTSSALTSAATSNSKSSSSSSSSSTSSSSSKQGKLIKNLKTSITSNELVQFSKLNPKRKHKSTMEIDITQLDKSRTNQQHVRSFEHSKLKLKHSESCSYDINKNNVISNLVLDEIIEEKSSLVSDTPKKRFRLFGTSENLENDNI